MKELHHISVTEQMALDYHQYPKPGKFETSPTKPHSSQQDLALAYSPGVAFPCEKIADNEKDVYKYTNKSNLVAVISNGTAVLGLGDIGASAAKPVMEGKALLFKIFAGIDSFDIEINETDPDKFVEIVKAISPTFGAINLEDIKAPECFKIEEKLREECNIPIMHDDQHGTAIITAAGLLNALKLQGKKIEELKLVVNGAGAAAIACTKLYITLGVKKENIVMCDHKGVIRKNRKELTPQKSYFATDKDLYTLTDALKGADMLLGLSVKDVVTPEMLLSMAENPIIFALANPDPEIDYATAMNTRKDIIYATGRSDYPNQINNVLGFPYIFRGALDSWATKINEEMKLAAVYALAKLAQDSENFDTMHIIPSPFDSRLLTSIAPAVAEAAIKSGVAHRNLNIEEYRKSLANLKK